MSSRNAASRPISSTSNTARPIPASSTSLSPDHLGCPGSGTDRHTSAGGCRGLASAGACPGLTSTVGCRGLASAGACPGLPSAGACPGLASTVGCRGLTVQRQLLHGKTANAAGRSSPHRPLAPSERATSPVRQMLDHSPSTDVVRLVVFGLVSMLLIVVGFTPLLQLLRTSKAHICADLQRHIPGASTVVILSLLSTLSPVITGSGVVGAVNKAGSLSSATTRTSLRRAGSARTLLACF